MAQQLDENEQKVSPSVQNSTKQRLGGWLPQNESHLVAYRRNLVKKVKSEICELHPVVSELYKLIVNTPLLRMDLVNAIEEAIHSGHELGYNDFEELLPLINAILTTSLSFNTTELVGCPLNALLNWPMCMPSGFSLFRSSILNDQLKKVLQAWCVFLNSKDSCEYLNEKDPYGWFSKTAFDSKKFNMDGIKCDPKLPNWGFKSWNDFFTRQFLPNARPIADPKNNLIIINACESSPYNIQNSVKLFDKFWIKSQPYSLMDIFTTDYAKYAKLFVGGTVYQAFLSAYCYHRWHAPVSGKIIERYNVEGTYYSDATSEKLDPGGPNDSQGYITSVAARAIIIIETDFGNVACVFVGMAEISSCQIEVDINQHVNKGDELGYFQYGGSTHCIIFEPSCQLNFVPQKPFNFNAPPSLVNSKLASVIPPEQDDSKNDQ